jgi:ssDNA-binding replication factor A large subunit
VNIKNGYINLFRGNMRLNVGRYGTIEVAETAIAEVNTENNVSNQVYEQPRRPFRGGGGRGGYGGRGGGVLHSTAGNQRLMRGSL